MLKPVSQQSLDTARGQWLIFSRDKLVVRQNQRQLPQGGFDDIDCLRAYHADVYELKDLQGDSLPQSTFIVDMGAEEPEGEHWELASLRHMLMQAPDTAFAVAGRAWQYVHFFRTHRYCGQCGDRTQRVDWEMAVQCQRCQHRSYPRVSPCIIVAVHDGERLLLARGVRHRELNMYSTLAGFVESGESLEQAVHREIFEEVGVSVTDLEYFGSQPWPFPHSLMVGYIARYAGGDIVPEEGEIDDAQWFWPDALPKTPPTLSIAGQLIAATVKKIQGK
ncbi:NAD(+) diphosphatase [Alteromonas halophila]|uniref:NAD(+) diphosphatase n=1 Tax=Alteromonas halophila TaxID=516698 RepID=A0A918MXE8_9ALTE|nr:NAD(+) diphosphatase [Alteromonas halophila]GGW83588.1 NADH pyrophosphatase [Alteromonas halophila]